MKVPESVLEMGLFCAGGFRRALLEVGANYYDDLIEFFECLLV